MGGNGVESAGNRVKEQKAGVAVPERQVAPEGRAVIESGAKNARDVVGQGADLGLIDAGKEVRAGLNDFTAGLSERAKDAKKMDNFVKWMEAQSEPEALRRAGVNAKMNLENYLEKYLRLASQFLVADEKESVNGKTVFNVDFKGNELAEWKVGAAHMLPPSAKSINVYDEGGDKIFSNATRAIVNGKMGYYADGKYAYVHTGYKIEVLTVDAPDSSEFNQRLKEENEFFDAQERLSVLKVSLQRFLTEKGVHFSVDESYFEHGLGNVEKSLPTDWWQKYLKGEFKEDGFVEVWKKSFSKEDLNLMTNLSALENLDGDEDHPKTLDFSDFSRIKGDAKFASLHGKVLEEKDLRNFKRDNLGNHAFSESIHSSAEVMANEPFEEGLDHFGGTVLLRKSAMVAFQKALKIAKSMGIELRVNSSYRSKARQRELYNEALLKYGNEKEARKWVALPGKSTHMTGGTVDIVAMKDGKGSIRHANQKYLWKIMPAAGFVNYEREPWHWEIYSERWRKKTGGSGPIYAGDADHDHDH